LLTFFFPSLTFVPPKSLLNIMNNFSSLPVPHPPQQHDVEEFPVDYLTISVAQRYSVLVTAKNETTSNYAVHYQFDESMFDVVPEGLKLNYTATVSYGEDLPFSDVEEQQERERTPDHLMSPVIVQEQLTPTRRVELGVLFDTFVRLISPSRR
jgi:iron transport multicopper oxidase